MHISMSGIYQKDQKWLEEEANKIYNHAYLKNINAWHVYKKSCK